MTSVTIAQLEYADTYSDPLPAQDMLDRMEELLRTRRAAVIALDNASFWLEVYGKHPQACDAERRASHINRRDQAAQRARTLTNEIVEVARQIVAEADNSELIAEQRVERPTLGPDDMCECAHPLLSHGERACRSYGCTCRRFVKVAVTA